MPTEQSEAKLDGQLDFSGGMRMVGVPNETEYRYASNIIIRNGSAETRPGFRRAFRMMQEGYREQFWFGDKEHGTGFWFNFSFVASIWRNIQGSCFYRFTNETESKQLIVADGRVYKNSRGLVSEVSVTNLLTTTVKLQFISSRTHVMMLRDDGGDAQYWDGSDSGFVPLPAGIVSSAPSSPVTGAYINKRFFLVAEKDNIYVSDAYSAKDYDYVYQLFGIASGDGDEITKILPFHSEYCLVFKKKRIDYLAGTNSEVVEGSTLRDVVQVANVTTEYGLVANRAIICHGEMVTFLSYKGIISIKRVEEGELVGTEIPLSSDIQPLIDRINWNFVSCACAGYHNNYLLFAVPMDGSKINNAVLVYDLLARSGSGAWVGVWESKLLNPIEFFEENEKLYFIGTDGALREMFSEDPWDSEDVFEDTPFWFADEQYWTGDIRRRDNSGVNTLWIATEDSLNADPLLGTGWTVITDPQHAYDISSEVRTRFYRNGHVTAGKRYGRCEILVKHQYPKWSLDCESENYNTKKTIFSDRTYDYTKYDVCDKADWVPTNENLDFSNPYRKDYPVLLNSGLLVNIAGSGSYRDGQIIGNEFSLTSGEILNIEIDCSISHGLPFSNFISIKLIKTNSHPASILYSGLISSGETKVISINEKISDLSSGTYGVYLFNSYSTTLTVSSISYIAFTKSLYVPSSGIPLNIWTPHSTRFFPRVINNQGYSLSIRNTRGRLAVTSVLNIAQQDRFAVKER